jgi:hypothetical protein
VKTAGVDPESTVTPAGVISSAWKTTARASSAAIKPVMWSSSLRGPKGGRACRRFFRATSYIKGNTDLGQDRSLDQPTAGSAGRPVAASDT